MNTKTLVSAIILVAIVVGAAVYFTRPKREAVTEPVTTENAPANKLPERNIRDIVQPGQAIGNDSGTTSTSTP